METRYISDQNMHPHYFRVNFARSFSHMKMRHSQKVWKYFQQDIRDQESPLSKLMKELENEEETLSKICIDRVRWKKVSYMDQNSVFMDRTKPWRAKRD